MRIRFTVGDSDPQGVVEAGIDGFGVVATECDPAEFAPRSPGAPRPQSGPDR
jgi:hypothetical protein